MRRLFIFNPETDFALAVGRSPYTPSAGIIALRKKLSLVMSVLADYGDAILMLDENDASDTDIRSLKGYDEAVAKKMTILSMSQLPLFADTHEGRMSIVPWGWNHTLLRTLLEAGVAGNCLPAESYIECLRGMAHRRNTISFLKLYGEIAGHLDVELPVELASFADASRWLADNPDAYLKSPWSSSGRGICYTSPTTTEKVHQWIRGMLRRQGSIMAEPAYRRTLDFASEWVIAEGRSRFIGFSIFDAQTDGGYSHNLQIKQEAAASLIASHTGRDPYDIVRVQQKVLNQLTAPFYSGPLGIDMLATADGRLDPCVEINMRHTMGHIALASCGEYTAV